MEKLKRYQAAIKSLIEEHAKSKPANSEIDLVGVVTNVALAASSISIGVVARIGVTDGARHGKF